MRIKMKVKTGLLSLLVAACLMGYYVQAQSVEPADEAETGTFSGNMDATHPSWFKESFLDFSEDIEEASAQGKRLVLYFWQAGCPYCNQLWAHNMAEEGIEAAFQAQYDVVAINMWGDQEVVTVAGKQFSEKDLARALDVDFTPTLLFYDENKNNILRLNGYLPPKKFKAALDYGSSQKTSGQTFGEYMLSLNDSGKGLSRNEAFFKTPEQALRDRSAQAGERPLAVLFETPDCESCEKFHDLTLGKHPETVDILAKMDVVQLNALSEDEITKPDGERTTARKWAAELGLGYYPSIAFFDEQGEQVMLMNAYFRSFHTQSIFAYVLEKGYLHEPSFQRYLTARSDGLREKGVDIDIWEE